MMSRERSVVIATDLFDVSYADDRQAMAQANLSTNRTQISANACNLRSSMALVVFHPIYREFGILGGWLEHEIGRAHV